MRISPRAAVALAACTLTAASAAPATATMLVYRDGDDVWQASVDGAIQQRVTTDGSAQAYYAFPSVDDAGTITAVKGSGSSRTIWVQPRGAASPTLNVMPWRPSSWVNIGPNWVRVKPTSGGSLAYTYYFNHGPFSGHPNGGLEDRLAIVNPLAPGSPTAPAIDQPAQSRPTWFGERLVAAKNGSIVFETQPLRFSNWLSDPNATLTHAEVDRAGTRVLVSRADGQVALAGWQGTVGSTAGTVTSQCLLPERGIAWAALSPEGTTVAWSSATGLYVATVTAANTTICPVGGSVRLSATGITPAFSSATLTAPEDPGRRDPTDPGRRDPTDPVERDPADPGRRDPVDPGGRVPADPGARDPADPGARGPAGPGTRDPAVPGGRGPAGAGDPPPGTGIVTAPPAKPFALTLPRAARATALRRGLRATVSAPAAGSVRAVATLRTSGRAARTLRLGSISAIVAAAGRRTLVVRPARAAAAQLRRGARLTLTVTFTPRGGKAVVRSATLAVR